MGSTILSTDYVELSFSTEFLLQSTSTVTWGKVVSGTASSITCTPTYTSGYLSYVKVEGLWACDSTSTYTIRLYNVRNILEAKAFSGTLTMNTKASATESIGTGTLTLSTVTTLTAGTLTSTTVSRTATSQGADSIFTLQFTTPGVLLDASTIQLGLPLNQIVMSSTAYTWTDPTTSTTLTCTASPTATSTYNYLTINEWKCSSPNWASGTTFNVQITQAKNPAVAAVAYDPFLIRFISPSSNQIFKEPSSLNALPDLSIGALNNHVITFQNTQYTLSTTEYIISFDTTGSIPAGGKVIFTFPDYRIWKSGTGAIVVKYGSSYSSTVATTTITWDASSTFLTKLSLDSLCTAAWAVGSYTFKITTGIKNPDYVQPLTGNFVSYTTDSSGAVVNRDIKSNSDVSPILPTPMTATIVRSSKSLGASTGLTVTFTTVNPFPDGGKILFYMPTDQISLDTSTTCLKGDLSTSLTCSVATSGSYYVVTINEWWTAGGANCAGGTPLSFYVQGVINPTLLSANVASTSWQVLTATSLSYAIDGAYTSLKPTPNLEGVAVTFTLATVANPVVYADTTLTVAFTPNSDLPSNAIIEIGLPTEFAFSPTVQSCSQLSPSSATLTCTYTTSSGYLTTISVTNPCSNSDWKSTTALIYQVNIKIRQNTKSVGGSFYVTTKTSTSDIGIGSYTNSITISPNPFTSTSLDNSGCTAIKATCSLKVKFTTVYTFPNKSNSGKIALTIPSDLTVVSTGWTATIGSLTMDWALAGTSVTATHTSTSSVAGMQIIITFDQITNPSSTQPTNSFVIYSQESVSGTYYSIDGVTSGLTYAATTLGSLSSVTVTRDTINTSNDGLKTGRYTNFLFSFVISNALATDGSLTIIFKL